MGFACRDAKGRKFYYDLIWNQSAKSETDWVLRCNAGQDLVLEILANGSCSTRESINHPEPHLVI